MVIGDLWVLYKENFCVGDNILKKQIKGAVEWREMVVGDLWVWSGM
jgi:hypothetical protein